MQRTTESTIITYAKVTMVDDKPEVFTAKTKLAEKDPDKAIKLFRKTNPTDSIITTETVAETGYVADGIWYLFESADKATAKKMEKAVKAVECEILELVHAKMMEISTEETEETDTEVEG